MLKIYDFAELTSYYTTGALRIVGRYGISRSQALDTRPTSDNASSQAHSAEEVSPPKEVSGSAEEVSGTPGGGDRIRVNGRNPCVDSTPRYPRTFKGVYSCRTLGLNRRRQPPLVCLQPLVLRDLRS